jgi:hypothetical protein
VAATSSGAQPMAAATLMKVRVERVIMRTRSSLAEIRHLCCYCTLLCSVLGTFGAG